MDNGTLTNAQKLEALIKKAIDGGWQHDVWSGSTLADRQMLVTDWLASDAYKQFIFNHDFARALFGEEEIITRPDQYGKLTRVFRGQPVSKPEPSNLEALLVPADKFHLQQAVIADNSIDYMYQAVFGGEDD